MSNIYIDIVALFSSYTVQYFADIKAQERERERERERKRERESL